MDILEQIARKVRDLDIPCYAGYRPPTPDRLSAVYGTDLRLPGDLDGSRFQIITRGTRNNADVLADALTIARALDDFQGLLCYGGDYIIRIQLESGPAEIGADDVGRLEYSANYRLFMC